MLWILFSSSVIISCRLSRWGKSSGLASATIAGSRAGSRGFTQRSIGSEPPANLETGNTSKNALYILNEHSALVWTLEPSSLTLPNWPSISAIALRKATPPAPAAARDAAKAHAASSRSRCRWRTAARNAFRPPPSESACAGTRYATARFMRSKSWRSPA